MSIKSSVSTTTLLREEVARLGLELSSLKDELQAERTKRQEAQTKLMSTQTKLRDKLNDFDTLSYEYDRTTARLKQVLAQVENEKRAKESSMRSGSSLFSSFINSATGTTGEIERLQELVAVLEHDLHIRIEEVKTMHLKLADADQTHRVNQEQLQEVVKKLEQQLKLERINTEEAKREIGGQYVELRKALKEREGILQWGNEWKHACLDAILALVVIEQQQHDTESQTSVELSPLIIQATNEMQRDATTTQSNNSVPSTTQSNNSVPITTQSNNEVQGDPPVVHSTSSLQLEGTTHPAHSIQHVHHISSLVTAMSRGPKTMKRLLHWTFQTSSAVLEILATSDDKVGSTMRVLQSIVAGFDGSLLKLDTNSWKQCFARYDEVVQAHSKLCEYGKLDVKGIQLEIHRKLVSFAEVLKQSPTTVEEPLVKKLIVELAALSYKAGGLESTRDIADKQNLCAMSAKLQLFYALVFGILTTFLAHYEATTCFPTGEESDSTRSNSQEVNKLDKHLRKKEQIHDDELCELQTQLHAAQFANQKLIEELERTEMELMRSQDSDDTQQHTVFSNVDVDERELKDENQPLINLVGIVSATQKIDDQIKLQNELVAAYNKLKQADSKYLRLYSAYKDAVSKVTSLANDHQRHTKQKSLWRNAMMQAREELESTRRNYKEQMKVITERVCSLEQDDALKTSELSRLNQLVKQFQKETLSSARKLAGNPFQ